MLVLLITCAPVLGGAPSAVQVGKPTAIQIRDASRGCFHSNAQNYEWALEEGGFRRGGAFLSTKKVNALRELILGSSGIPSDLLAQVGITPASVTVHRADIVLTAWPDTQQPEKAGETVLSPELERLLTYESIAPRVLDELTGCNWSSTTHCELAIEIPGEPVIRIGSDGLVPWKLPWEIEAGGKKWQSCDIGLSRALLPLVDPNGPNASLLDGTGYWSTEFWRDERFWSRFVGEALDTSLTEQQHSRLDGYLKAIDRFRVQRAQSGAINMQPDALFLVLATRDPSTLDGAWWWNPLSDNKPTSNWNDFVSIYDAASRAVEKQPWLQEWKAAGPARTLEVHAVGKTGFAETMRDAFVLPPWKHAWFRGEPEFEILLRRKEKWCGTVWLSSEERGALIETAHADGGLHWFDRLEFSFHPKKPTYGRVDAAGIFELQSIER